MNPRNQLHKMISGWEQNLRVSRIDDYPYGLTLDSLLFQADWRYGDYIQFQDEGEFPVRLLKWINNLNHENQRKLLFKLLPLIIFIDRSQMGSLYRDAFKRVIAPWIRERDFTPYDYFRQDHEERLLLELRKYALYSITKSFSFPEFLHINDIQGLPEPELLGETLSRLKDKLPVDAADTRDVIIFEDFVGTGNQARSVLQEVSLHAKSRRILFVPLLMLERGLDLFRDKPIQNVTLEPVLVVPHRMCVTETPRNDDDELLHNIRSLVKATASRVKERLNKIDDPPDSAFGFRGSGALLVTCHNTPNNTIPLIHHRAPRWNPLFRRQHHWHAEQLSKASPKPGSRSKDGLR